MEERWLIGHLAAIVGRQNPVVLGKHSLRHHSLTGLTTGVEIRQSQPRQDDQRKIEDEAFRGFHERAVVVVSCMK